MIFGILLGLQIVLIALAVYAELVDRRRQRAVRALLESHHQALALRLDALQQDRDRLERILAFQTEEQEAKKKLWLGAFLPTDEHARSLEQQMLAAEDHAISAVGPTPFSPLRLRASAGRFGRGRSTPGARNSGSR